MNKTLRYFLSWNFISLVFSILGTISLFGELNVITFSEWLNNVMAAYRLLVYPVFEFIFSPLLRFLAFDIDPWEIDLIVVIYFFVNRFLADMVAYEFVTFFRSGDPTGSNQRQFVLNIQNRKLRRFFVYLYSVEKKVSKIKSIIMSLMRNIVLILALIILVIAFNDLEVSRPENIQSYHIVLFFMALYIFPLFIAAKLCFVFSVGFMIYVIKYILYTIGLVKKPSYENPRYKDEFNVLKGQAKFCFQFTFGFLMVIGINYKYLV